MCIKTKQQEEFIAVSNCLRYLEETGWSDLIDSRWEDKVVEELRQQFPDITDEVLVRVLNLVLV